MRPHLAAFTAYRLQPDSAQEGNAAKNRSLRHPASGLAGKKGTICAGSAFIRAREGATKRRGIFSFPKLGGHMCTSLNQLTKIALLLTAIDVAGVLLPVTAHAGSVFRRAIDAVLPPPRRHRQNKSTNDSFFKWSRKISMAGIHWPSGIFNSVWNLYCHFYERNLV